jgi:hypothetical protein
LWTVFVFLASNSPDEIASRSAGWMALPLIRNIPGATLSFAAHPITLSVTFFLLGVWAAIAIRNVLTRLQTLNPWKGLGSEVTLMGYEIDNMSSFVPDHAVLGRLNLLIGKLKANGFDCPPGGPLDRDHMSRYLHQVGAYLSDGNADAARAAAARLSPPSPRESGF